LWFTAHFARGACKGKLDVYQIACETQARAAARYGTRRCIGVERKSCLYRRTAAGLQPGRLPAVQRGNSGYRARHGVHGPQQVAAVAAVPRLLPPWTGARRHGGSILPAELSALAARDAESSVGLACARGRLQSRTAICLACEPGSIAARSVGRHASCFKCNLPV